VNKAARATLEAAWCGVVIRSAWTIVSGLRQADHEGVLARAFQPSLSDAERAPARVEGWILGVG
jgi:hypothetical protein